MILNLKDVTKVYKSKNKKVVANNNISIQVDKGEVFGLFGHNGAGKTTLVNQIIGNLKPDKGEIFVAGENIIQKPERGRYLCSVQPQTQIPLGGLTPRKVVTIMGKMRGATDEECTKEVKRLFESLDIMEWADTPGMNLSGGVLRLTSFCMAAIKPGSVLILDEPTNDVDPIRRRLLWDLIKKINNDGTAVLLVTHNIKEAESAVDKVAIINNGKVLVNGSKTVVKNMIDNFVNISCTLSRRETKVEIPSWCNKYLYENNQVRLYIDKGKVQGAIDWASNYIEKGLLEDYLLSQTSLEDVYVDLIHNEEENINELEN